jgi:hypothetical protein
MTTESASVGEVAARSSAPAITTPQVRPVLWYAGAGALLVLLHFWIMGSWVLSDDFKPAPRGSDPIPQSVLWSIYAAQGVSVCLALFALVWYWRSSRKEGRLTLPAIIGIAWFLTVWQDPLSGYIRPAFFYNAYFVNMGSWSPHVPGWTSPSAGRLPEPFLYTSLMYFYVFAFIAIGVDALLKWMRSRLPGLSSIQLCIGVCLLCMVADTAMELVFLKSKLYGWPGIPPGWAAFPGTTYQFPLYEALLWGPTWASTACLYAFRDAKGETWLDRGLDRAPVTRFRSLLRVLAMVVFTNTVMFVYNIGLNVFQLKSAETPAGFESWLRSGLCGEGTAYPCVGPDTPIYTITSGPPGSAENQSPN